MIIGFTGTQEGMTQAQKDTITSYLNRLPEDEPIELHHGDCIGADADMHQIVHKLAELLGSNGHVEIYIHPPDIDAKRAFCKDYTSIFPMKPYLQRNRDIVDCCDVLIATPKEKKEVTRSGTWSTIRYSKREYVKTLVVYPDGTSSMFNER